MEAILKGLVCFKSSRVGDINLWHGWREAARDRRGNLVGRTGRPEELVALAMKKGEGAKELGSAVARTSWDHILGPPVVDAVPPFSQDPSLEPRPEKDTPLKAGSL